MVAGLHYNPEQKLNTQGLACMHGMARARVDKGQIWDELYPFVEACFITQSLGLILVVLLSLEGWTDNWET